MPQLDWPKALDFDDFTAWLKTLPPEHDFQAASNSMRRCLWCPIASYLRKRLGGYWYVTGETASSVTEDLTCPNNSDYFLTPTWAREFVYMYDADRKTTTSGRAVLVVGELSKYLAPSARYPQAHRPSA